MTSRLDFKKINLDQIEMTPQGFLRFPVYAGKVGIQTYKNADGSITREFRPPEQVFRPETMDSLKNVPVVNDHPENMVNPENAKELTVGFGSESVEAVDNKFQKTSVTVFDKNAIEDIQNGKVEVSLGYDLELEEKSGTFEGQEFDAIQKDIVINHLAIVDRGRAGPEVRLRFDRFDAIMYYKENSDEKKYKESSMPKLKIGDQEFEVEKEVKDAVDGFIENLSKKVKDAEGAAEEKEEEKDEAEEGKKAAEKKVDRLQGKNDALEEKIEKLEKSQKSKIDCDDITKLVKARRDVEDVATALVEEKELDKMDSMTDKELKILVIKKSSKNEVKLDGKSDDYIDARFDTIKEMSDYSSKENKDASNAFKNKIENEDGEVVDWRKAQKDSMKRDSEGWQTPIGRTASK